MVLPPLLSPTDVRDTAVLPLPMVTPLVFITVFLYRATKVRQHISLKINWQRECVAYTVLFVQMGTAFFGWIGMVLQILPMGCLLFLYKKEFGVVVNKVKERIGW